MDGPKGIILFNSDVTLTNTRQKDVGSVMIWAGIAKPNN